MRKTIWLNELNLLIFQVISVVATVGFEFGGLWYHLKILTGLLEFNEFKLGQPWNGPYSCKVGEKSPSYQLQVSSLSTRKLGFCGSSFQRVSILNCCLIQGDKGGRKQQEYIWVFFPVYIIWTWWSIVFCARSRVKTDPGLNLKSHLIIFIIKKTAEANSYWMHKMTGLGLNAFC